MLAAARFLPPNVSKCRKISIFSDNYKSLKTITGLVSKVNIYILYLLFLSFDHRLVITKIIFLSPIIASVLRPSLICVVSIKN